MDVFSENFQRLLRPVFGKSLVGKMLKIMRFAVRSLSALANEMLKVNSKTRGAFMLIAVLLYSTYLIGLAVFMTLTVQDRKQRDEINYLLDDGIIGSYDECNNLYSCVFTVFRLILFDKVGFDMAKRFMHERFGLFILLMTHLCMSSFAIINGLVGIFANIFFTVSMETLDSSYDSDDEVESSESHNMNAGGDSNDKEEENFEISDHFSSNAAENAAIGGIQNNFKPVYHRGNSRHSYAVDGNFTAAIPEVDEGYHASHSIVGTENQALEIIDTRLKRAVSRFNELQRAYDHNIQVTQSLLDQIVQLTALNSVHKN